LINWLIDNYLKIAKLKLVNYLLEPAVRFSAKGGSASLELINVGGELTFSGAPG